MTVSSIETLEDQKTNKYIRQDDLNKLAQCEEAWLMKFNFAKGGEASTNQADYSWFFPA